MLGSRIRGSQHPETIGITPGQQGGPRCSAHRLSHMKVGETHSLCGQTVEIRGHHMGASITAEISVPLIIREDDDHIRSLCSQLARRKQEPENRGAGEQTRCESRGGAECHRVTC